MSAGAGARRALSNASWLTAAKLSGYAVSLLLFVVLSRAFGPRGVGEYAYGGALGAFLALFAAWGLVDYGVRKFVVLDAESQRRALARLLAAQGALTLVGAVAFVLFLLGTAADASTAAVATELAFFQLCVVTAQTLFVPSFAREAMAVPAFSEAMSRALAAGSALAAVLLGGASLPLALLGFPVAGGLLVIWAWFHARRLLGPFSAMVPPAEIAGEVRGAWPFAASELASLVWGRADVVMLGLMAGEAAAGLYAVAVKLIEVAALPLQYLCFAVYPRLTSIAADRQRLTAATVEAGRAVLLASALLLWAVYYVAPAALPFLFGDSFALSAPVIRGLSILLPILGVEILTAHLLLAGGDTLRRLRFQAYAVGGNLALNLLLIPRLGMTGAIIASVAAMSVGALLNLAGSRRLIEPRPLFGSVAVFLALLGSAAGAALFAHWWTARPWAAAAAALAGFWTAVAATGYARSLAVRFSAALGVRA